MKKIILFLLLFIGIRRTIYSRTSADISTYKSIPQDSVPVHYEHSSDRTVRKMADSLKLTPIQREAVRKSYQSLDSSRKALYEKWHTQPDSLAFGLRLWSRKCDSVFYSILDKRQFFLFGMNKKYFIYNN